MAIRDPQGIFRGLVLVFGLALCAGASADLSLKDLTGSAVSEVGPYVTDVNVAIRLFSQGDFAGALKHLQEAKKATPVLAPAEVMMARLHFSAGQVAAGNAMLEKALVAAPNDPEPALMLIERGVLENRLTEAALLMPQAEKLVAAFSENPRRKQDFLNRVYLTGAAIDQSRQRPDAAQAKLEALLKLDPTNAGAHQRLGQLYFEKGDAESQKRAWEAFKRAAEADPIALPADMMMAMLSKDPAKATEWVQFAIKNSPNDPRSFIGATNHYLKEGQLDKAQQYAAQAVKLDENGFESNFLSGIAAQVAGNYAKAVEYLSRAYLLQPSNPSVVNQLTLALLELGGDENQARALTFAQLNARLNPDNMEALAVLGWVNYRLKRMPEADRAFQTVLSGRLNFNADTTFMLAYLMAVQRNREEAARMLRSILDRKQLFAYRPQAEKLMLEIGKIPAAAGTPPANPQATPAAGQ